MQNYFRLMRAKHYIKNLMIFFPLVFSGELLNWSSFRPCLLGFLAFSLLSSTVYILNDLVDVERDRAHPVKKNRPIASGAVSPRNAILCGAACLIAGAFFQFLTRQSVSAICLPIYIILNIFYSFYFKTKAFGDIIILVSGFFIRVMYGAMLAGVAISAWLYLTVIAASFYMSLGKRRNELKKTGGETREVLRAYSYEFLDKNMYMCVAIANVFYALWAMNGEEKMLPTVPVVLLLSMRYSYDIEKDESQGDPVDVIIGDKVFLLASAAYALYTLTALYIL